MDQRIVNGLIILGAGLFASSVSSFLEYFTILGTAIEFTTGFFDGLSAVAFGVAIYILARSQRSTR